MLLAATNCVTPITLKLYGRIGKSLELFERLYNKLIKRNDDFSKAIIPHLYNCYAILVIELGQKRKKLSFGEIYCQKILNLIENDFFAIANLAVFQYKLGEINKSEETVELLLSLYPKNPTTEVDVAFFRILQKRYTDAYKHYIKLIKFAELGFNPQEVIEFLGYEYEKQKEPALLYGIGVISAYFGDKKLAKKELELFLKKANKNKYKPMYSHAKDMLNEINL